MSKLNITITEEQKTVILHLKGSADMSEICLLDQLVSEALKTEIVNVIVDLTELIFTCSMGLSILIKTMAICHGKNGQFLLVNPQSKIQKILKTTRLDQIFPIYPNLEDAQAALTND